MGIDTNYWIVVRSNEPLVIQCPPERDSPQWSEAQHLLSQLQSVCGNRDRVASSYIKNGSPSEVAQSFDELAPSILRTHEDRLILFSSLDGDLALDGWKLDDDDGVVRRSTYELAWDDMPEAFVPDETASCCAVFTSGSDDSVDLRLASALDPAFKEGLRRALVDEGIFFWNETESRLKGVAVAIQKFVTTVDYHCPVVLAYQTPIEGCFAWICSAEREWPKHIRLPFSFSQSPGGLVR